MLLDLESLASVRRFSKEVLRDFPKINVLINNAGLSVPVCQCRKTKDGYEVHFGVNHLGHFLLTNLLLPRLKDSAPSR
jgi:NAD(P)-dependent dehydrogenase (short-subunit alcohol dehydrogenase family)